MKKNFTNLQNFIFMDEIIGNYQKYQKITENLSTVYTFFRYFILFTNISSQQALVNDAYFSQH